MSLLQVHIAGWDKPWMTSKTLLLNPWGAHSARLASRDVAQDGIALSPEWDILQLEAT